MIKKVLVMGVLAALSVGCKTSNPIVKAPETEKKGDFKPYNKVITKEAVTDSGLFTIHKVKDDYFYEIPDTIFAEL